MCRIHTIIAVLAVAVTASHSLAENVPSGGKKPMSMEAKREAARRGVMKHLGGYVIQPGTQKGHVAFFNGQGRIGNTIFDAYVSRMRTLMHLTAKAYPQLRKVTPKNAAGLMADVDAQAAVFLVDDEDLPALLTAPEAKWAIVNIAALSSDKPDDEKLRLRVTREIWRALAYACGAGISTTPHCVMNPCYSLADLDAVDSDMISMEPFMTMRDAFPKMGISPFRRVTYKVAVQEGWAPAPTNEWQQAIWDKVKSGETGNNGVKR